MRIRSALLLLSAVLSLFLVACSGEGEGQPCDRNAGGSPQGTDDCQSGLTCQFAPNPAVDGPNSFRCCPPNLTQAKTPECTVPSAGIDASPLPPDAPSGDAPTESAVDAPGAETGPSDASDGAIPADAADGAPADGGAG
jgi:hypothetical protein